MDNNQDLIQLPQTGVIAEFKQEDFAVVSKAGDYLPRLALFGGTTNACKEGKIRVGHWGVQRNKNTIEDLGAEADILVVHGHPKALKIDPVTNAITSSYKPNDPLFQAIVDGSEIEDSGCMYGPEFLVYVFGIKDWATLFLSSKSGRGMSAQVFQRLRKAATMKAEYIKKGKFSWHAPVCVPCTTIYDLPPTEEIVKVTTKFSKVATDPQVQAASAAEAAATSSDRD